MRLQKYMASCGIGSRRRCEEIIKEGRVTVNGSTVTEMGFKIDPHKDHVKVDGRHIRPEETKDYILLHKRRGTVTTARDQFNRPTVIDEIGPQKNRLYPVGRLDYDTEGLLILTNDGDLAAYLTHPKHAVEKEYHAVIRGTPDEGKLNMIRRGIDIGGYKTSPAVIRKIVYDKTMGNTRLNIIIKEGKNRQIRRMFDQINHPVIFLKRVRLGPVTIGSLKPGEWRHLTAEEITMLKNWVKGEKRIDSFQKAKAWGYRQHL
jgi:23S rRNA pseudouridine2605 synthase